MEGRRRLAIPLALITATAAFLLPAGVADSGASGGVQVVGWFQDFIPPDVDGILPPPSVVAHRNPTIPFVVFLVPVERVPDALTRLHARADMYAAYASSSAQVMFTPNDPLYAQQWGPAAIGLEEAWDSQRGTSSVKVAVIDTGIDYGHKDLGASLFQFQDGFDAAPPLGRPQCGPDAGYDFGSVPRRDDGLQVPTLTAQDDHGHGTHVAGTVAALSHNLRGVAGVSQSCIMVVKVLDATGSGTWAQVSAGILHASTAGAHILSMSLGGFFFEDPAEEELLRTAVEYAWDRGALLVVAAGNSRCGADTVAYPARYPQSIAVSALQAPGTDLADFSSCGPAVDLAAPGADVISTWLGGGYRTANGTSMATPHVSGVAALVKSENLQLTNVQVRCLLESTAVDLGTLGPDASFGRGRVAALAAVQAASDPNSVGC